MIYIYSRTWESRAHIDIVKEVTTYWKFLEDHEDFVFFFLESCHLEKMKGMGLHHGKSSYFMGNRRFWLEGSEMKRTTVFSKEPHHQYGKSESPFFLKKKEGAILEKVFFFFRSVHSVFRNWTRDFGKWHFQKKGRFKTSGEKENHRNL